MLHPDGIDPMSGAAVPKGASGSGRHAPLKLPPRRARQRYRPAQSNIPDDPQVRAQLRRIAAAHVGREKVIPPVALEELRRHAEQVLQLAGAPPRYRDYATILVSNEAWRDTVAGIPYDRRLLLLPKCLRNSHHCPAPIDELGLVCQECGRCSVKELKVEAERLGYVVMVAEGSAMVTNLIQTGRIEAIIGVSCMDVLEKCFAHMESRALPGLAIPLLQDGCADTTVDLEWVRDAICLSSRDRTFRLDLEALRREVQHWFGPESLQRLIGSADGETESIAREWLARAGKRWRPYLTVCASVALTGSNRPSVSGAASDQPPEVPDDLKRLAVAVECFHKASLVHDDIEDGDERRYGERTLHVEHGVPVALNVGDFLVGEGYRLIGEVTCAAETQAAMFRVAAEGHRNLSRGQGAELCWVRSRGPLKSVDVLDIFRFKTAPAFEVALRLGALYAGGDSQVHEVLSRYSEALGIAYQIRDDLEDFAGRGDSHDLRGRRPSLVLAIAHKQASPGAETALVTSLWDRTSSYESVASELVSFIRERGVIDKAEELLEAYQLQAIRSLNPLTNPTLKGLLRRVIGKIFGKDQFQGYCRELEARNARGGEASKDTAA
ncbi:MAG: polyprenyl synthetase family protein [Planctomycetota bacterium]